MKILVVDDEYMFGSLLSRALQRLGHDTSVVAHPMDALDVCREQTFDAVITDIDMPDMNGVELARKLRDTYDDLPVAFCTGSDPGTKAMTEARQLGEVLPKVWTVAQVKAVVDGLSSSRQQQLARGSKVMIPTSTAAQPEMVMRRRADTVPGRRSMRKIKVNCKTWREVEKLCDEQSEGRNLLTIRGKHPLEAGERITVALRLPDELVLAIAAKVERIKPLGDDKNAYVIRLIGLTPEMCTRMRSLILEATSGSFKPRYMKVKAVGSETEIDTAPDGAVIGNLRLRKQIDALGRLGTEHDDNDDEDFTN